MAMAATAAPVATTAVTGCKCGTTATVEAGNTEAWTCELSKIDDPDADESSASKVMATMGAAALAVAALY